MWPLVPMQWGRHARRRAEDHRRRPPHRRHAAGRAAPADLL